MGGKKKKTLMIIHLILLALLALANIVSLIILVITGGELLVTDYLILFANFFALSCGIFYLANGYSKNAAIFYKAFIFLTMLSDAFYVITMAINTNYDFGAIIIGFVISLLLVLTFVKNLGKEMTWLVFCAIIIANLVYGIVFERNIYALPIVIVDVIAKLVMNATLGLAIFGKYKDKEERGTE